MVVFQPKLSIIMNWHDVLPIDKDFIVHKPCKLKDCFIKNMSRIQLSVACIYYSGQSWLINTYPQNFIVLVHFWPKLMWTSSIKEVHDMWFQLSVAYIFIILAKADWWISDHKILLLLSISGQSWCGLDQ